MLAEFDMTWIIEHEVLRLTTAEVAKNRRVTCVYNLAALIGDRSRSSTLRVERLDSESQATSDGSAEELAQVIWKTVVPVGQRDESTDLSIVPYRNLLIVRHTQQGQRQVTELLEQLKIGLVPAR